MEKTLINIGLNEKEVRVYLTVLNIGSASYSQIENKTNLKRPTLYYDIVPKLLSQHLLTQTVVGKRKYLTANSLDDFYNHKQKCLQELENIIPYINTILTNKNIKPQVSFYDGHEGIKQVWLTHLQEGAAIREFVGINNMHEELEKYVSNHYIRERVKRKIPVKMLAPKSESKKFTVRSNMLELREVKFTDSDIIKIPLCFDIYGENVSITLTRRDSSPVGIIIKSKEISTFMASIFDSLWLDALNE